MNLSSLVILFLLVFPFPARSGAISDRDARRFVRAVLWSNPNLASWVEPHEAALAHRLGIEYDGVAYKNLIGYDLDDSTKGLVRRRKIQYGIKVETLEEDFARVTLSIANGAPPRVCYFKGNQFVSPERYFTRKWSVVETEHFRFILSDSGLSNPYSRETLEMFVARMRGLLRFNARDMDRLREQKILYYLCRDEDEIQRLTGFRLRGMCDLAMDAVVSTYNTHEHELLHLLINYKLRRLPLYTHPFVQEGFAVAYGGRGGLAPDVLLSLGRFLYRSQSVELASLLEEDGFRQSDPSLSYPAAGLYNRFLVETLGMESYLRLYRRFSRSNRDVAGLHIPAAMLPGDSLWNSYLQGSAGRNAVTLDSASARSRVVYEHGRDMVSEDNEHLFFSLSGGMLWSGPEKIGNYSSQAFRDAFPAKHYGGEKYMIQVGPDEVSVYNLFTNTLVASYASAFAIPPARVPVIDNSYRFAVERSIFEGPPGSLRPSTGE